jgi:hypothetical protein
MQCIIALAGPTKSGKTTLAKRLATSLAVPYGSFGDQVRKEALRRGLTECSKAQLQVLRCEMVQTDTRSFCQAVLNDAGYSSEHGLVLDGIRHVDVLAMIRVLVGDQPVELVYLDSSAAGRAKGSLEETQRLQEIDSHPVERDAPKLKSVADLVLDTSEDADRAFETLLEWVKQRCE